MDEPQGLDQFISGIGGSEGAPMQEPEGLDDFVDETQQDLYGGVGQQALAGAEGFLRGASLGTSDLAETKLGLSTPEAIKGRREANPWTSGLGSLGGGAALIGLTGGMAAPAEAGLGATLATSAAEGALFGAGNSVSEYALGDSNLNAQKVLTDVGMGAALGAGLGALGKSVEYAAPKAAEKLNSALSGMKEAILGTEENPSIAAQAISRAGGAVSGEGATDWASAMNQGLNAPEKSVSIRDLSKNLGDIYSGARNASSELYDTILPSRVSSSLKDMPEETARANAESVWQKIQGKLRGADLEGNQVSALSPASEKEVVGRLQNFADDLSGAKSSDQVFKTMSDFATDLDRGKLIKFDTLPTASQLQDQEVLRGIRDIIRSDLKNPSVWGEAATHYAEAADNYSSYKNAMRNFEKAFMSSEKSAYGNKKFIVNPTKVKAFFNNFLDPSQDIRKQYLNDFMSAAQGLAKKSENFHGAQEAESLIARRIGELSEKHQELQNLAEALGEGKRPGGVFGGILGDMFQAEGLHAMGVPSPVVGAAIGAARAYKSITNPYEMGANMASVFRGLQTIGKISESVGKNIGKAAKNIFRSGGPTEGAVNFTLPKGDYSTRVQQIQQLADDPEKMMKHLDKTTGPVYHIAPGITGALQTTMINGVQFLNSKIPRQANKLPLSPEFKPSVAQKERFENYYKIINNPLSALEQVKEGTINNDTIEALQAVHPQIYDEMKKAVLEHFNPEKMEDMPYAKKIALGKFLGQPLDANMLPQVIAKNQSTMLLPSSSDQAPNRPLRGTAKGLTNLKVSNRKATETQQLEEESA